jgi:hypothetical protein
MADFKHDERWLENELVEFERAGLIRKVLVNKSDKPFFLWKAMVLDTYPF